MKDDKKLYLDIFHSIDFEKVVDHPNILIAARFWDDNRYNAAKVCYKLMRYIDDLIDDYKSTHTTIAEADREHFEKDVERWIGGIRDRFQNDAVNREILETFDAFHIPIWPMEAFAKSMIFDIGHDGFATLPEFLEYAEGASVAPAAIFVHLCGLTGEKGSYGEPAFDVREAARACAVFSYLVHIIRDFQKDQLNHLSYFADDRMAFHGLDRRIMSDMAQGLTPIQPGFRSLIAEYLQVADAYRRKTYDIILRIKPLLDARSQLSLEIIFALYLMVFERIDPATSHFTAAELNPTWQEVKDRVLDTIMNFEPVDCRMLER